MAINIIGSVHKCLVLSYWLLLARPCSYQVLWHLHIIVELIRYFFFTRPEQLAQLLALILHTAHRSEQ